MAARIEHHTSRMLMVTMLSLSMPACTAHDHAQRAASGPIASGDLVTGEELVATGASSLYDALVRTRGNFFRSRGVSSLYNQPTDAILVFRGGAITGTMIVISMLRPTDVRFVRRISATETKQRYGRNVSVGGLELELVNAR